MAKRPVFEIGEGNKIFQKREVEFKYNPGFADIQKKKNIASLHQAYLEKRPNSKVLEISTKSDLELGVKLSAFNLRLTLKSGNTVPVECIFQASKVFEFGGPYFDLIYKSPREAKKDERLKKSGKIIGFQFCKREYSAEPKTLYYNWLYVNTLNQNKVLTSQLIDYSAFTDIEFNPEKSINCQAEAAAIFVSLQKRNVLDLALASMENFIKFVYPDFSNNMNMDNGECTQLSLDDYLNSL